MAREIYARKTEDKINDLEKELLNPKINENRRREIYVLLGRYHDLYAWEKTGINSKLNRSQKLEIKEEHYKKTIDFYLKAGYENGNEFEMSRLAGEYMKIANVYEEMGNRNYPEALEYLKKADVLLIKCKRKNLSPKIRQLTEEEKRQGIENNKRAGAIPFGTYP